MRLGVDEPGAVLAVDQRTQRTFSLAVLPDKDGDGFRLGPDGQRFQFGLEVGFASHADTAELVRRYWEAVGVELNVLVEDRSLLHERALANEHDATMWPGDGGNLDILLRPRWYMPSGHNSRADQAIAWADWYKSGGAAGEEPVEPVRQQFELYRQINETADPAEQVALMEEILAIAKEQFLVIGISSKPLDYGVVKNHFHNIPDSMVSSNLSPHPGNTEPSQYYTTTN